ncbi:diguanylate cyclase domain-containing protein [Paucibacter soli]|uniref:diguanylate cyclase domain-containing protein n=1 Tax=Paucibacter soli TaxID=3133433 RepID=UPI0030B002BB
MSASPIQPVMPCAAAAGAASRQAQAVACEPLVLADARQLAAVLNRELVQCRRFGRGGLSVLLIDAWPHPPLGEPLSAEGGQRLRQAVAARLRARVRGGDVVATLGEQQHRLAVILLNAGRKESDLVQARLHKALGGPYGVEERHLYMRLVMGAAAYPAAGGSGEELVSAATAMLARHAGTPLRA